MIVAAVLSSSSTNGAPAPSSNNPSNGEKALLKLLEEVNGSSKRDEADIDALEARDASSFLAGEAEEPPAPDVLDAEFAQGVIVFYEGARASGRLLGMIPDFGVQRSKLTEKDAPLADDKAQSCILQGVRAGAVVSIYDSPEGDRSDDWTVITVKKTHPRYVITTFESNIDDDYVQVRHMRKNGLNGKVSRVDVD